MPVYRCTLVRSFAVEVQAQSAKEAKDFTEYFMGYCDDSTAEDRIKYNFEIQRIKMLQNDAIEADLDLSEP
jgi:hypothetical protein